MDQKFKRFPLRVILSASTGRLLTERRGPHDNGIGDIYDILNWMTNDDIMTHQIPRCFKECQPWLLRWFPELGPASTASSLASLDKWLATDRTGGQEAVKMWLTELRMMFPEIKQEYDVPQIPQDDHERKDPYDELVAMRGSDEGIIVVNP